MAFQAVANSGSITKAAQLLHVSQPSISKHVKNLERDCGVKLFERNAGAAELTDAGSSLLRHVDAILRSEEHTSELQSQFHLVCRLLLEKKKKKKKKKYQQQK